jgi:hypothetical protein
MAEQAANSLADLGDLHRRVNGAVINVQGLRTAPLVQGAAQSADECVGILGEEELGVTTNAAGIVDEGDEFRLGVALAVFDEGSNHRVGLPELVGVGLGKGEVANDRPNGVHLRPAVHD